jgi:class 3 adenylate cyclase
MPYYENCFNIITGYDGIVEKVMGDGIIAVFSKLFNGNEKYRNADNAIYCLLDIIERYYPNVRYNSKGVVHFSKPFFCKIGNETDYKEFTVIGGGLTYCYRLENSINHSDILALVDDQYPIFSNSRLNKYEYKKKIIELSGIGHTSIRFYRIKPK